jgi:hypothetical protein
MGTSKAAVIAKSFNFTARVYLPLRVLTPSSIEEARTRYAPTDAFESGRDGAIMRHTLGASCATVRETVNSDGI